MRKFKGIAIALCATTAALLAGCSQKYEPLGKPSPAKQPYPDITATLTETGIPESPDPLVAWRWNDPKSTDDLEVYTVNPVQITTGQPSSFKGMDALVQGKGAISIRGTGELMIDFGQVNAAWLEFDSEDLSGEVEMSISEYQEPSILNTGAQHRIKTLKPVRYGNTYRLELNDELYEGVRFGWIHVTSFVEPWHIDRIRLVCQMKPTNYNGSFHCSDPELTKIWYTGAYGVKLNLLKEFFGAILMERSDRFSWTGDAYASQAAALVAFGNRDFVLTNIHHTAEQDNGILSYSMYWIQSLTDYYYYSGDKVTLIRYIDNARFKLDRAYEHYGAEPRLAFYGWDERLGAGFEDHSCRESQNAYKMLCIDSWLDFAGMMESVGRRELASRYRGYANEKIRELREDPHWYRSLGIHAASDAINAGFTTREEQQAMYDLVFRDRLNRLSYSPFNQYFIIRALAAMGRYDEALETVSDCWGGQLEYGATTFFEVFRPSWNGVLGTNEAPPNNQCGYTSFCHPWGGGVVHWLTEEVLGVKPVRPGFRTFTWMPHPGSGLEQANGRIPTPAGDIVVSYDTRKGRYEIDVPEGTEGSVGIPVIAESITECRLDGQPVTGEMISGDHMLVEGIGKGHHIFEVEYQGMQQPYKGSEMVYPAGNVTEDRVTSGNWGGVYGSDGYALCACREEGDSVTDVRDLPAYVKGIRYAKQLGIQWAGQTKDQRAPASGPGNGIERSAGAVYTQDPRPTFQTMTVDIHMDPGESRQIALYFVDWDDAGRRLAVEMFDLETKRLVAPVQVVRDFTNGKYLLFSYHAPVRFRINHVRGPNATLSGIFFDTVSN